MSIVAKRSPISATAEQLLKFGKLSGSASRGADLCVGIFLLRNHVCALSKWGPSRVQRMLIANDRSSKIPKAETAGEVLEGGGQAFPNAVRSTRSLCPAADLGVQCIRLVGSGRRFYKSNILVIFYSPASEKLIRLYKRPIGLFALLYGDVNTEC